MAFAPIPEEYKQNNSVSTQFNKTFKSAVTDIGSAIDGNLKAAPSSAGEALNSVSSVAGALGKLGLSVGTSISQALNQLSGVGSFSKFKDTFVPPSKIDDIPPEETAKLRLGFKGTLYYPEDLGQYFILFTFKKYDRKIPLSNPIDIKEVTIGLPIPTNLQEQFNMTYSDVSLGLLGAGESVLPNFNQSAETVASQTKENVQKFVSSVGGESAAFYGASTLSGLTDATAGAVSKIGGAVKNPYQALLFQGVSLRSHTFTYRFSPNSQTEHQTLKKIIHEFKSRMHPTKDALLYLFPDVVDIKFGKKDSEPYFFKTCFLESMSVNYAPQGTPAFFAQTSDPVEVEISLSFKETSQVTRQDFKSPEDPTFYGPY